MKLAPQFTRRRLKNGAYWICDPSYAWPEDILRPIWEQVKDGLPAMVDVGDEQIFMWFTAHGDGLYEVYGPKCGSVGVDSGCLSIIPISLIRKWGVEQKMADMESTGLVTSIRLARSLDVDEMNGDVFFGDYCVDTTGFMQSENPPE